MLDNSGYFNLKNLIIIHYLKADKIFFFEYFISFVYCII